MGQEAFNGTRHAADVDSLGEQPRIPVPPPSDESMKLPRSLATAVVRFVLHLPERPHPALLFDDLFDPVHTEASDQLVLEVVDARIETTVFEPPPHGYAGRFWIDRSTYVTLSPDVVQTCELYISLSSPERRHKARDVGRATHRHDSDLLVTKASPAT